MKQQRNTRQRQIILSTVQSRSDHPTADEVYLDVQKQDNKISRGTVYRNLNILAKNGEILSIHMPEADIFDFRKDPHYHVKCVLCDNVRDVSVPYNPDMNSLVKNETGYDLVDHYLIFQGVCSDCKTD